MNNATMIDMATDDAAEEAARQLTACPSCQAPIDRGHLCCWRCFKHETPSGAKPLKWSGLGYRAWLETLKPTP